MLVFNNQRVVLAHHPHSLFASLVTRIGRGRMPVRNFPSFSDPFWRIFYNRDAEMKVVGPRHTLQLPPETFALLPAWLPWRLVVEQPVDHCYITFETPSIDAERVRGIFGGAVLLEEFCDRRALLLDMRETLQEHLKHPGRKDLSFRIHAFVMEVLAAGERRWEILGNTSAHLQKILDSIDEQLPRPFTLDALFARHGMSEKAGRALFRRELRQNPLQYVRNRRLARACTALSMTDESIEVIAEMCGFPNRYYMSRVFTKELGIAPAAYRKRLHPAVNR